MASPIPLQFGLHPVSARSRRNRYARCVNVIKEVKDGLIVLYGRPGLERIIEEDDGNVRAILVANEKLYYISNNKFYQVSKDLEATEKGTLNSSSGDAKLEFDGTFITMVDGSSFYTYNIGTDTFAENTDASIPSNPSRLMFIDGFHYVNNPDTGEFHTHSDAFQPDSTWNGDFATAEYAGDYLLNMVRDSSFAYLFGTNSIEIWEPNPEGSFPLKPNIGSYVEFGTAAPKTPVQFANGIHWLAQDNKGGYLAMRLERARPSRISTHELENEWNSYSDVSDAYSMVWNISGHSLWLLHFPTPNKTWVYDESIPTNDPNLKWAEFQIYNSNVEKIGGIDGVQAAFFNTNSYGNIIVIGDGSSGKLFKVSFDDLDDAGIPIQVIVSSQEIMARDNSYIDHPEVELFLETGPGVSLSPSRGSELEPEEPKIELKYSDDHGHTWTNKAWTSLGKVGEYTKRIRYRGLGRSRHRYYEITISDPVRKALFAAVIKRDGVGDPSKERLSRALGEVVNPSE